MVSALRAPTHITFMANELEDLPQTLAEALGHAAVAVILPEGEGESTAPAQIADQKQSSDYVMVGDPLLDLPAAEQGGSVVAIAEASHNNVDDFMKEYGIDIVDVEQQQGWKMWASAAWKEALKRLDIYESDDRETPDDSVVRSASSIWDLEAKYAHVHGRAPEGTLVSAWYMLKLVCGYINQTVFFRNFFRFLIVFNTVYLGFQVDNNWSGYFQDAVDNLFIGLFAIEIVIRVCSQEHLSTHKPFLLFDIAIVLVSVVDKWVLPLVLGIHPDVRVIQSFRVLRIIRLTRLLRFVRWLRPLRLMERSLRRGVLMFVTIMGFLVLYLYPTSIIFKTLTRDTFTETIWRDTQDGFDGNILRFMVYLLEAIFCGFDWVGTLVRPLLEEEAKDGAGVLLMMFMFISKIALMNVFTGTMVENFIATMKVDTVEMEYAYLHRSLKVHELEQLLDQAADNLDLITWHAFEAFAKTDESGPKLLRLLGINPDVTVFNTEADIRLNMLTLFQTLDVASEKAIPVELFKLGYVKLKGSKKTLQMMIQDFQLKRVIISARKHGTFVRPIERELLGIESYLEEQRRRVKIAFIDIEEMLRPIRLGFSKLEATFAALDESLRCPEDTSEEVPAACAMVANAALQAEVAALRRAAQAFVDSRAQAARAALRRAELKRVEELSAEEDAALWWERQAELRVEQKSLEDDAKRWWKKMGF